MQRRTFTKYSEAATASSEQDDSVETEEIWETSESLVNYSEQITAIAEVEASPSTQPKIRAPSGVCGARRASEGKGTTAETPKHRSIRSQQEEA